MTAAQFRAVLKRLGLSQGKAAEFLGVSLRTAHGYANGEHPIPEAIAKLLRLIVRHNLEPGEIK
jgi:DNA-binding transcriptional regulator YiaG